MSLSSVMRTLMAAALVCNTTAAGEFNEVLSIGDAAPSWSDIPGTDGRKHGLDDLKDKEVVVLVFTCASCPTAVDYEGRINDLAKKYGASDSKVGLVVACVNAVAADKLPALAERQKSKDFAFHYLYDESQKIARDHGAIFTPEFFVFGKDRKLVYMGALDDATDASQVKTQYVELAIAAALEGKQPQTRETIARGCRVRYARERRQ